MFRRFLMLFFPFLFMFATDPNSGGGGDGKTDPPGGNSGAGAGGGGQPGAAAVDIQAEIQKALAAQQGEFAKQFKAATGFDSLEAFQTEQAKKKGEEGRLLEERTAELNRTKQELADAQVRSALSDAAVAAKAIDPATVVALLAAQGKAENGAITVGGKSPAEAVAALLKDKPFLVQAGQPGGGTPPGGAGAGGNTLSRAEFEKLDPSGRMDFIKKGGKVV